LLAFIQAHPDAQVTMDPSKTTQNETPNLLSDFSSRGYGPGYRIKPDLVAPGQDIYSAVETDKAGGELFDPTGFASADGTSFSAPHVTGAVALLLQQHPKWTPAMIKDVLTETANDTAVTIPGTATPSVMDIGSGLLDVQNALGATSYLSPSSASVGQTNVGYGPQNQTQTLTLTDLGSSGGTWSGSILQLHSTSGLSVSIPGSVHVDPGKGATIALHLSESASTAPGSYDGYAVLQNGSQTLHVPYFVHVASQAVGSGSVLLVDDTTSNFQAPPPNPPVPHVDVSRFYEQALHAIHKPYTYWNEAVQGDPGLPDLKRASAAIYFTGANLNGFSHANANYEALDGPFDSVDMGNIHSYLDSGGRVFVTGLAALMSDPGWAQFVLGAGVSGLSEYDNVHNDKNSTGGISPPKPSAVPDKRKSVRSNRWLFGNLRPLDFSTSGNGAKDNVAVNNTATANVFNGSPKLVGVTDLSPFAGSDSFFGTAYGKAVLRTSDIGHADGNGDVAVANSDEPSFTHRVKHTGRSIAFSFDFAGINDNTGYATREQVLRRIFQWFTDRPTVKVAAVPYAVGRPIKLRAILHAGSGAHAVQYRWQVNGHALAATSGITYHQFASRGRYKLRVLVTDSLGHLAVSGYTTVKAG
ncbi:MAG: S8 family serine peptidase, partial [Chloroflexota bacterium]